MVVGLHQLQIAIIFGSKCLCVFCSLIIHDNLFGLETFGGQELKLCFVSVVYAYIVQACNWSCKDWVGVVVVKYEEAHASIIGHEWEWSR